MTIGISNSHNINAVVVLDFNIIPMCFPPEEGWGGEKS